MFREMHGPDDDLQILLVSLATSRRPRRSASSHVLFFAAAATALFIPLRFLVSCRLRLECLLDNLYASFSQTQPHTLVIGIAGRDTHSAAICNSCDTGMQTHTVVAVASSEDTHIATRCSSMREPQH